MAAMQVSQLHAGVCGRPLPIRARPNVSASRSSRPLVVEAKRKRQLNKESRIGKVPITIPKGVSVTLDGQKVTVKGKGGLVMSETLPDLLDIQQQEDGTLRLRKRVDTRKADQVHGLYRSLTNNMMVGLSEGFTRELVLNGVGYRAQTDSGALTMNLGYSHIVGMTIPKDIQCTVVKNTTVRLSSHDKISVGDFAAKIRSQRKPEPYKGKGVRYADEVVRRKEGKRGK